jgi:hypothetical protein
MYYYGEASDNAGNRWHFCTDEVDCVPACAVKVNSSEAKPVWYVGVKDGARQGFLLGPYSEPTEAEGNVKRAKELARQNDPFSHFYGFGLCSAPAEVQIQTVFGV